MRTHKFLVSPQDLQHREIERYEDIPNRSIISRWHCSPSHYLVGAIEASDWIFFGTILVTVDMSGVLMPAVAITHFDHSQGLITSAIHTGNTIINTADRNRSFSQTMAKVFTPIGRSLRILRPDAYFDFQPIEPLGQGFGDYPINSMFSQDGRVN